MDQQLHPEDDYGFDSGDGEFEADGDRGGYGDLEDIHREHFAFVWRTLNNLGVPPAALDDAVQDVFLVVHRRIDDFEGRAELRTWLFAIARRVAYRHRRTAERQQRKLEALAEVVPTQLGPDAFVERHEAADILAGFLASLDNAKREVFVLHTLEGITGGDIASTLGISVNTVHSRLRLARQSFERMCKTLHVREEGAIARARTSSQPPPQARRHAWALLLPMIELPRGGLGLGASATLAAKVKVFAATIAIGAASLGAIKLSTSGPEDTPNVLVSAASAASQAPPRAAPRHASPPAPAIEPTTDSDPGDGQDLAPPRPSMLEPSGSAQPPPSGLPAETRAMLDLRAAVQAGDSATALDLIARANDEFADGSFEIERKGYRAIALCQADRQREGRGLASLFLRDHPSSPVAAQVRSICLN